MLVIIISLTLFMALDILQYGAKKIRKRNGGDKFGKK